MKKVGLLVLFAVLLLSVAAPVLADGPEGDVIIWGDDYTLSSGQRIKGDLLVYGGNVTLQENSEVDGNVSVFGGNLTIAGEVDGDVTVWGGNVNIEEEATVRGKVVSIGGNVDRKEGADVRGGEVEGWPVPPIPPLPRLPERPSVPAVPTPPRLPNPPTMPRSPHFPDISGSRPWRNNVARGIAGFFRSAFGILVMVVLGILVVVFIPRHTETVAETMVKFPVQSFFSGLVGLIGGVIALVLLSLIGALLTATICLAPIGLALFLPWIVGGVALLFGWIAAGLLLGVKVLRALTHKEPNQVLAVAVGIPALSVLSMVPCVGWLLAVVALTWSVGAVIYSLFGTRTDFSKPIFPSNNSTTSDAEEYDPRMDQL